MRVRVGVRHGEVVREARHCCVRGSRRAEGTGGYGLNCAEWAHVKQKVLLQVGSSKCAVPTRTRARQTSRLALRNAARRWPSVFHRFPLHLQPFTVLVCVTDLPEELREVLVLALDLEEDEEERVVQRLGALLAARIPHPPGPRLTRHPPVDRKTNSLIGSERTESKREC